MTEEGVWVMPPPAPYRRSYSYTPRRASVEGKVSVKQRLNADNLKITKKTKIPRGIASAVKAILDGQADVKFTRAAATLNARGTIASVDPIQIMPTLAQGTTSSTRTGNDIMIKSFTIDLLIAPVASSSFFPSKFRILVFRPKDRGNRPFDAAQAANFYDTGAGSAPGDGGWSNQVTIPNPQLFETLYDKLTPVMQWQTAVPAAGAVTNTHILLNQFNYTIDLKEARGRLRYDDNNTDSSKYIYLLVQAVNMNNTNVNAAGLNVGEFYYNLNCCYTDL